MERVTMTLNERSETSVRPRRLIVSAREPTIIPLDLSDRCSLRESSFTTDSFDEKTLCQSGAETVINERSRPIIYATIDSLALKRATLPLQLLPIGEYSIDDKPASNETRLGTSRRNTPRRPSFKVRSAGIGAMTSQWMCRSNPPNGRYEDVAKDGNITRQCDNQRDCDESRPPKIDDSAEILKCIRKKQHLNARSLRSDRVVKITDYVGEPNETRRCSNIGEMVEQHDKTPIEIKSSKLLTKECPNIAAVDEPRVRSNGSNNKATKHRNKPEFGKNVLYRGPICTTNKRHANKPRAGNDASFVKTANNTDRGRKNLSRKALLRNASKNFLHPATRSAATLGFNGLDDKFDIIEDTLEQLAERNNRGRVVERVVTLPPLVENSRVVKINDHCRATPIHEFTEPATCSGVNRSFLSGTTERATRRINVVNDSSRIAEGGIILSKETNADYNAYDDVDYTAENLYDDVGLAAVTRSSSRDTIFEELDEGCGLYDDVFPLGNHNAKSIVTPDISSGNFGSLEKIPENNDDNHDYLSIDYSSVELEKLETHVLYDDVELCQERVNSLYAGSAQSEWEEAAGAPNFPVKKNNASLANADSPSSNKKKQRRSRKVRRQKSSRVSSRKNPGRSSRTPEERGTTLSVAVSLGTGSVLLVGNDDSRPSAEKSDDASTTRSKQNVHDQQLRTSRGVLQLRILRSHENSIDTQETSCYVLEDTASDDSEFSSFPSDEFSSDEDRKDDSIGNLLTRNDRPEAPTRPVPSPPRESSITESIGKRMKILRRTWSITKGSLGRMRRRASTNGIPTDSCVNNIDDAGKKNREQQSSGNDAGRKYFSFKKHFGKVTGHSTFYLETNEHRGNNDETLSPYNNRSNEECNTGSYTDYSNGDHYSILDEEPLYQFYTAARVESDSEGYEEVPSTTVDLAKPGHRTLWCQTARVINSPLLESLTSDEKRVQEAKFEIITSEASYLNSLRVLVDEFFNNHDLVYEVLATSEREKLFGGVPSVLMASERLLAELEAIWREDLMLGGLPELLLNYAEKSSRIYVAYCSNQVSIDTTLKELRGRKAFVDTMTRIESDPACQNLSLHSFLMLPMQRVTRLPLLADAVLSKLSTEKKEERRRWELALAQLSKVVIECNEGARAAERLAEMEALERKLEYSGKVAPIILRDRHLIRRGPVIQIIAKSDVDYRLTFGKRYHKSSLYLLLLTDYLLIAKTPRTNEAETYTVVDTCKRSLVALEKLTEDSPFAGRNALILTLLENHSGRHAEYILTCENPTERERWLDAISPPKPSLVGETLYETWDCPQVMALYHYAAAQPDELTLQPGDVINVLRKMTGGWYLGEKLLGGEQGWFPGNYAKEIASEHVRARNLRQRNRLLALSASVLQQRAKQMSR